MTTVAALFRYPVKSMQGVALDRAELGPDGVDGDRRWGLVDVASGRLMSAKRWSALLHASADDETITLPDGRRIAVDAPDIDVLLSDWLGRDVRLVEAGDTDGLAYEMTFEPPNDDAEYVPIDVPAGSLLDLAAAHLVAAPTLRGAADRHPDLDWDVRRFRPNLVVDGELEPFGEDEWVGRTLRVGTAELAVRQPTVRCAMPLRSQPGLERQAELFAVLDELHDNHLGLYLDVVTPGRVEVGDEVVVA